MRTIEYRLWDKKDRKMLYYDKDVVPNMTLNGVLIDEKGSNVSQRYEVMESLNCTDVKGNKMYNGDVVEFYMKDHTNCINNRGYIQYVEMGLQYWVSLFFPKGVSECGGDEFLVLHSDDEWEQDDDCHIGANECEIIGNIFEEKYEEYRRESDDFK